MKNKTMTLSESEQICLIESLDFIESAVHQSLRNTCSPTYILELRSMLDNIQSIREKVNGE